MKEKIINWLIKVTKADTNKISDGYHTFEQLYEHRIELWIALCEYVRMDEHAYEEVWKSKTHSDGSVWPGWFILGIGKEKGHQMTYHLPMKYWKDVYANTLRKAPKFDGHTPSEVIKRLRKL